MKDFIQQNINNDNTIMSICNHSQLTCSNQVPMCKLNFRPCTFVGNEKECPNHDIISPDDKIPTFAEWLNIYEELASKRYARIGQLNKETRRHIISCVKGYMDVMHISLNDKVSVINRKSLHEYIKRISNQRKITIKAKIQKIQQCFARWIRFEVEDTWELPKFDLPELKDDFGRFHEPSPDIILKIKLWYRDLRNTGNGHYKNKNYLYITSSLHYAMRNGDINRLKWSNIKVINGRPRLEYTPNKTKLSSKRDLKIWMNDLDYYDFMEYRNRLKEYGFPHGDDDYIFGGGSNSDLQSNLNKQIGSLGVEGCKKIYLCRKLCISETYKQQGKEASVAISGDSFPTIARFYSDIDSIHVSPPKSLCI